MRQSAVDFARIPHLTSPDTSITIQVLVYPLLFNFENCHYTFKYIVGSCGVIRNIEIHAPSKTVGGDSDESAHSIPATSFKHSIWA